MLTELNAYRKIHNGNQVEFNFSDQERETALHALRDIKSSHPSMTILTALTGKNEDQIDKLICYPKDANSVEAVLQKNGLKAE